MAKCKYCQAELPEDTTLCPGCGKDNKEETKETREEVSREAPRCSPEITSEGTPGKTALMIAVVVVLAALLVALVYTGMNRPPVSADAAQASEATVPATIPADGNPADETAKGTYTASDKEVIAAKDAVVARMGEYTLTNSQLQMFYWMEVRNFLSGYGAYASYLGLDTTKPLDMQTCAIGQTPCTWQQFFLASALNSWRNYQATAAEAQKSGYQLDADTQEQLDSAVENLEMTASLYGYESAEALLTADAGVGAGIVDYQHYLDLCYTGSVYFYNMYENQSPSDEEIEAYFAENEEAYAASGLTRDSKTVDIRHVLIMPEGATSQNIRSETFPDDAWQSSRQKAEELLAQWEEGDKSEESFAELAKANSDDGSASEGGLYTGVQEGQMVQAFNDWCFDSARQPGDYGIVETEFGYHLMFFVKSTPVWKESAKDDMISARANEALNKILETYPIEVEYDKILLGFVDLNPAQEEPAQEQPDAEPVKGDTRTWIIAGVSAVLLTVAAVAFRKKEEEM